MSEQRLSGKIQTVTGTIDPSELGATLSHEHVLCDSSFLYKEPDERKLTDEPVKIENLEWLRRHGVGCVDNLKLLDENVAIDEVLRFKRAGGGALVDMGNVGLFRDPDGLALVSRATDVNIVMGSGYYVGGSHPKEMPKRSDDDLV